ncbi:MAG: S1 RNA-binding domain-containing protein [Anaerolineae bacterium]|nr:MAG: S1 RNA-binding domain-containing protein [Anaerolineae bacterium]
METSPVQPTQESQVERKKRFSGKVIKVTLAGAVVDIGLDKPGVVHISQLRVEPVKRVDEVVQLGQQVDVWLRRMKPDANYYDLTMIEPLGLEWREIKKGMVVSGKVVKFEKFGVFIDIGAERPGLAHVSELSHDYIRSAEDVVKLGEEVQAKVLDFDRRKRQIKLSLKALHDEPKAILEVQEEAREPAKTAFELAYLRAMANAEGQSDTVASVEPGSKNKKVSTEQEEILARTLENRRK